MGELVIDIGNTRMKMVLVTQGRPGKPQGAPTGDLAAVRAYCGQRKPERIIVGSVAQEALAFISRLEEWAPVVVIKADGPSPVRSRYASPDSLGVDRLANVVAAAKLFPHRAVVVIDLGTCITYDLLDEHAVYHGGAITPGLAMRAKAMHDHSARLPLVDHTRPAELPGRDTTESLVVGVQHGSALEMAGFIAEFRKKHPRLLVVLTGGDAVWAAGNLKNGIFVHPSLTLIGLYELAHHASHTPVDLHP